MLSLSGNPNRPLQTIRGRLAPLYPPREQMLAWERLRGPGWGPLRVA